MTADVIEEVVPSSFFRSGAHRDAPTSNSGAAWSLRQFLFATSSSTV
jgi:hypothetical protein